MHRHRHLEHPGLYPLWTSLQREWYQVLMALLLVVVASSGMTVVGYFKFNLMLILGGVLFMTSLYGLGRHLLQPSSLDQLRQILHEDPRQIVWVYTLRTNYQPFGLQFLQQSLLYIKLADGTEFTANLPARKLKLVAKILHRALPHIIFGYSTDRARLYALNPQTFLEEIRNR